MPRMSQEILTHMSSGEMPPEIKLDLDENGGFAIAFEG